MKLTKQNLIKLRIQLPLNEDFKFTKFRQGVFSNVHPAEIVEDGKKYPTAEHYYMSKKAEFFGDHRTVDLIDKNHDPIRARELGRKVKGFDEAAWLVVKDDYMRQAQVLKYQQNENLLGSLLKTDDDVLVYCNSADLYWGNGVDIMDKRASEPMEWPGDNVLGFILMDVRSSLRNETKN